jgi:hypothetical protein
MFRWKRAEKKERLTVDKSIVRRVRVKHTIAFFAPRQLYTYLKVRDAFDATYATPRVSTQLAPAPAHYPLPTVQRWLPSLDGSSQSPIPT